MVKAVAWYDNEWGYSNRCVELAAKVLERQPAAGLSLSPKSSVRNAPAEGRRVLVRADLNVPLDGGAVADDTRIRAALPTLELLLERGAAIVLVSHLGRPKGSDPALSMAPVRDRLAELLGVPVELAPAVVGDDVRSARRGHGAGRGAAAREQPLRARARRRTTRRSPRPGASSRTST